MLNILSVFCGLASATGELTCPVIMDHLDWFAPRSKDVKDRMFELVRVISLGGFMLWQSVARQPWYQSQKCK